VEVVRPRSAHHFLPARGLHVFCRITHLLVLVFLWTSCKIQTLHDSKLLNRVIIMADRKSKKTDVVQVKNPRSGKYVKIDRAKGKILDHKKSDGPYKNVPVARKKSGK
jgi:hypothetical protein